jgi:hypothetical protein
MNFAALSLARALGAPAPADLARDILRELVKIDTSDSRDDNTTAASAMARRLLDAGFPEAGVQLLVPPTSARATWSRA